MVGTFEGWPNWVLLGDSKGKARLFNVGQPDKVPPSNFQAERLVFDWSASDSLVVAFYTTVCDESLFILSQGSQVTLSLIITNSVCPRFAELISGFVLSRLQ